MSTGIYKITNLVDGKYYIGKSVRIERRFEEHKNGIQSAILLSRAINKYGVDNFKFEILEECSKENLNEREKFWIKELEAQDRNKGYNIHPGGDGGDVCSCMPPDMYEEFCRKISAGQKGKKFSPERIRKMSEMFSGEGNPMYGKHASPKQKEAAAKAARETEWTDERRAVLSKRNSEIMTGRHWMNKDGEIKFVNDEEMIILHSEGWHDGMGKRNNHNKLESSSTIESVTDEKSISE